MLNRAATINGPRSAGHRRRTAIPGRPSGEPALGNGLRSANGSGEACDTFLVYTRLRQGTAGGGDNSGRSVDYRVGVLAA